MMKHFGRIFLAVTIAAFLLTTTAWDKLNENDDLNIEIPGPMIILSGPPDFIMPYPLGFYVAVDIPFDLYQISNIYFLFYDNGWYRGTYYNGPWRAVNSNQLPQSLRCHNPDEIRVIRDKEYRHW
ncbi:MAG: hypothetical protein ABIK92_00835 [Pseudomonadota bacterium]